MSERSEPRDELGAVHVGHHHVSQDEVDVTRAALQVLERLATARGFVDAITLALEHAPHKPSDRRLVLDDQYVRGRCGLVGSRLLRDANRRIEDREGRAAADLGVDGDSPLACSTMP